MEILIIGGNKFFGKRLATLHIDQGHKVTLLNRGNVDDGFKENVDRIVCDRTDTSKMKKELESKSWDIVYDQVCFDFETAKEACEIFKGKTKKFVFTSTQSVYGEGSDIKESSFDPKTHSFDKEETAQSNYGEAKRQAEVAFTRHASFPVAMLRFSLVLGEDDPTGRLTWHIDRIKNETPIYLPSLDAKVSMIHSSDAANALFKVGTSEFTGPINATGAEPIELSHLISSIESKYNKKAILLNNEDKENWSPYGISSDWWMNTDLLQSEFFKAKGPDSWLSTLI
ncbi:MAG: NAD-dependent epimerase/dehydratase family protein [Bacteriovoracaceae bacterium]|nr:NAD-dependent epimerase/dehydratase family protein [Bacteriovoracaceae bacterium]